MAVPVVASFTNNVAGGTSSTEVTLTKPSGVQVGDLLILLAGCEDNTASTSFAAITGWTKAYEYGDATPDTKIGMYWRIADGTEGASETVDWSATGSDAGGGWYLRITGADTTDPLHLLGTSATTSGNTTINVPSLTTTLNNCLIFSHASFDGGDGYPFSSSGTGWPSTIPTNQEIQDTSDGAAWAGAWVTKSLATAGASQQHSFSSNASDGWSAVQFAIVELQAGISSVSPNEFDMDEASVTISGAGFGATQGTGTVYISDANTLAGSVNEVEIANGINTWSDTAPNLDLTNLNATELSNLHTLGPGTRYVIVVTNGSDEYGSPPVTLHRPEAFIMSLSANFAPGTTTAQLAAPSGKTTGDMDGGRIEEALNPSTTNTTVTIDDYREDEWCFKAVDNARDVAYIFRVLYGGNVPNTISVTPQVTISGGYTLNAESGSYSYTGTSANLEADRILSAESSSYTYTGQDVILVHDYAISAEVGNYSYTGITANLLVGYKIPVDSGSYIYTGLDASLEQTYKLNAESTTYSYTGFSVGLYYGRSVIADAGNYVYTGQDATLVYVPAGAYILTAESGSYAYSGNDATLKYNKLIEASSGVYTYTGNDAELIHGYIINAEAGSYVYSGQDASLIYIPAAGYTINAEAGNYSYSGQSASLLSDKKLVSESGSYLANGQTANLLYGYNLAADSGSYAYNGQDITLLFDRILDIESGSYLYSGQIVDLLYSGATGPEEPGFEYTIPGGLLHFTFKSDHIEYTQPINKLHYLFRNEQ